MSRNRVGFADASDHRLQTDTASFALVIDLLPFGEVLPPRRHAADPAFRSVRQDDDGVVPEDLWDRVSIVGEVVLEGVLKRLVRCLQFDEEQRDAVDESDEIGPLPAVLARNPELRSEKEIVLAGVSPSQ